MDVEWWAVDFKTGNRVGRLNVASSGSVERIIGQPTDATVRVRTADNGVAIVGWDEMTQPRRMLLVAVDRDGDQIIWGGLSRRRSSKSDAWAEVSCDTLEAYFSQRYIGSTVTWTDADPSQIAADAVALITDLPPLTVRATMTGNAVVDGFYEESDRKRIGELLSDLSGLANGIEWTVDLEWVDADHTQVRYVVRIAPRIGVTSDNATQWTMPGCVTDFTFIEDAGESNFGNDVIAYSSGEGESKPRSTRYEDTALLSLYARFERRFDPARSITATQTLDQYAEAELARTRLGLTQLEVTANLDAAPQVNRDWALGDDIDVSLTCDRFPQTVGSDGFKQAGYERRLRTVGWKMDFDARTITPKILEAS